MSRVFTMARKVVNVAILTERILVAEKRVYGRVRLPFAGFNGAPTYADFGEENSLDLCIVNRFA